jgi:energy-coupling factor transporter ATP-binding protein EcfA2
MNMVREFNQQLGMTIVMVTHERALAERYAQRLIFLADGKLVGDETNAAVAAGASGPDTFAQGERA